MTGIVAGIGVRAVLGSALGKAGGIFKGVPRWAWIALAVVALLLAGVIVHQHKAKAALKAADEAGYARGVAVYQRALKIVHDRAVKRRQAHEALEAKVTAKWKGKHDAEVRHIASDADDLRVRGPGAAAAADCGRVDHPGLSAGADRPVAAGQPVDSAPGEVHPEDRLARVPWSWLVDVAEQCDVSRAEALTWRGWYVEQSAAWERMRGAPVKQTQGKKGTTDGR